MDQPQSRPQRTSHVADIAAASIASLAVAIVAAVADADAFGRSKQRLAQSPPSWPCARSRAALRSAPQPACEHDGAGGERNDRQHRHRKQKGQADLAGRSEAANGAEALRRVCLGISHRPGVAGHGRGAADTEVQRRNQQRNVAEAAALLQVGQQQRQALVIAAQQLDHAGGDGRVPRERRPVA